jgi:hypothetical protein
VHQLGLKLFGATMWKLLIINHFLNENKIKWNLKIVLKFEGILGVVGKPLVREV